ncbi:MAG TPA: nitroreductase family protein [Candidatus Corynebacterium avicola]|uniref:Nitroreductase family protein n=1 Tax=Candidatus Corynebacterium avicola TaxID=2838527 RepID=A0A9D1ULD7_9CORY|nr:nitroreductase family protein [Candidatus Corynebacterium avicola]
MNDPLSARYGRDQDWEVASNDTVDALLRHRSVRLWLDREVDDTALNSMLAAAQSAATSSNKQVVSVIAVRDAAVKQAIASIGKRMSSHVATAPVLLVWLIDFSQHRFLAEREAARGPADGDAEEVHGVSSRPPHDLGALDYLDEPMLGALDIGIAAQNAVVAAESLGLGTVYLGSLRNDIEQVQEILDVPETVVPFLGLAVGWGDPAENAGVKPRLPRELVVHHDRYNRREDAAGQAERARLLADYDDALENYFARYGSHPQWSAQTLHRMSEAAATKTRRHLLRRILEKAGFTLR